MPHVYSEEARVRRRDRAARLGYVEPRPKGHRYILVEARYEQAVRAACGSLRMHFEHDDLTKEQHHHGRLATLCAKQFGAIGENEFDEANRWHRRAGRLKHGISRWRVKPDASDDVGDTDVVYMNDPWAGKELPRSTFVASSRDNDNDDMWSEWALRRVSGRGEAVESWEVESSGALQHSLLIDVMVNEIMGYVAREARAAAESIESSLPRGSEGELDDDMHMLPVSSATCEYDEFDLEATSCEHDDAILAHLCSLNKFVHEWEQFQRVLLEELKAARSRLDLLVAPVGDGGGSESVFHCLEGGVGLDLGEVGEHREAIAQMGMCFARFHFAVLQFKSVAFESDGLDFATYMAVSSPMLAEEYDAHNPYLESAENAMDIYASILPFLADASSCEQQEVQGALLDFAFAHHLERQWAHELTDSIMRSADGPIFLRVIEFYSRERELERA